MVLEGVVNRKELIALQEFITIPTHLIKELPQDKLYALLDILSMADENGEVPICVRELMKRWGWSNTKVTGFIKKITEKDIGKTEKRQEKDTVFLVNTGLLEGVKDRKKTKNNQKTTTEKDSEQSEDTEIYKRIIEHLNMVCGTRYKHTTTGNVKDLKARLKEEYTEEDFYTVIDKKAKEWLGTECEKYLRPSTLFGNKFGEYINQKIVEDKPKNKFNDFPQREYDFDELEKQLLNR